jgi:hypothetical protein
MDVEAAGGAIISLRRGRAMNRRDVETPNAGEINGRYPLP